MPPLKNIKHEIFAHNVVKHKGNQTKAYKDTFVGTKDECAKDNGSRLIARDSVRERVVEILNKKGLSFDNLMDKLGSHVHSITENISLEATKFSYRLHGALDEDKIDQSGSINIGIVV